MVMGNQVDQITSAAEAAIDPYAEELEREQLRKARLATTEKWKEFYALLFAFIAFSVPIKPRCYGSLLSLLALNPCMVFLCWGGFGWRLNLGILVGGSGDI